MKLRTLLGAWLMVFGSCFSRTLAVAEGQGERPATAVIAELQKQIDQLQAGQQRMLKELQDIKALLAVRDGRAEVGARPPAAGVIRLNVLGEPFRGDARARVAIVEYSDFDCSHCAKYAAEVYPLLDRDYLQTQRIKYFFRDLPAPGVPVSLLKARVARCAGEQGKFWEMHDRLFRKLSAAPADQEPGALAKSLSLDLEKFNVCLNSDRYHDAIQRNTVGARRMGITGTPAFLIGTVSEDGNFFQAAKQQLGGEKLEDFTVVLDELLAAPPRN